MPTCAPDGRMPTARCHVHAPSSSLPHELPAPHGWKTPGNAMPAQPTPRASPSGANRKISRSTPGQDQPKESEHAVGLAEKPHRVGLYAGRPPAHLLQLHHAMGSLTGSHARAFFQHGPGARGNIHTASLGPKSGHANILKLQNTASSSEAKGIVQRTNCTAKEISSMSLLTEGSVHRGRPEKNHPRT